MSGKTKQWMAILGVVGVAAMAALTDAMAKGLSWKVMVPMVAGAIIGALGHIFPVSVIDPGPRAEPALPPPLPPPPDKGAA